jgi:hypothetical protein
MMLKKVDVRFLMILGMVLLAMFFVGCTKEQPAEEPEEVAEEAVEEAPAEVDLTAVAAKLASFDDKDGAVDMILNKCAGCAFTMDGTEDNRLDVAGYQLHFCSPDCKARFEEDPAGAIMALVVEEAPEP